MWRPITKEVYMQQVGELKPVQSISDPDGTSPYGNGRPWLETIWGHEDKRILKSIISKVDRHQKHWDEHYFQHI